jgi:hypothetical protein
MALLQPKSNGGRHGVGQSARDSRGATLRRLLRLGERTLKVQRVDRFGEQEVLRARLVPGSRPRVPAWISTDGDAQKT